MRDEALAELRTFNEVIERLRAPGGCPWDRAQTHQSLAPFLLEETYEVLEAIDKGEVALREELGDLLLQVLIHSAIAAENRDGGEGFDIGDVAAATTAKMIHRHPHVFGEVAVSGVEDVVVNWEKLKATEKHERESLLDGIPKTLPALAQAQSVQKRPARLGLDVTSRDQAADSVAAALQSVITAAGAALPAPAIGAEWTATDGGFARGAATSAGDAAAPPDAAVSTAMGELLFAVVALSRAMRVDAEDALRVRTNAFAARFRRLESRARVDRVDLHALNAEQWAQRWAIAAHEDTSTPA